MKAFRLAFQLPRLHHRSVRTVAYLAGTQINLPQTPRTPTRLPTTTHPAPWHHQRRRYQISLAHNHESPNPDSNSSSVQPLSQEEMKRNNLISTRLYRILLKSCLRDLRVGNAGNKIFSGSSDDDGNDGGHDRILLQPRLDFRTYGHANIYSVHTGRLETNLDSFNITTGDGGRTELASGYNPAIKSMNRQQVGRAMDVLRFVHTSLGGDADDDLEDYYLGSLQENSGDSDSQEATRNQFGEQDLVNNLDASAGRHAEGHYTHFVDDDEERGEGPTATLQNEEESDDEKDEYHATSHDPNEYPGPRDPSVLVQTSDLSNALRIAFRAPLSPSSREESLQTIIARRHRDAIDASSLLSEQIRTWSNKSSICVNNKHGVRVTATTSTISAPETGGVRLGGKRYRFAYRIRVENINGNDAAGGEENGEEAKAVQLLGRTWNIYECRQTSGSLLAKLLEEGSVPNSGGGESCCMEEKDNIQVRTLVANVNEPKTGAVGHFPVIRPGEVFEYMSGCEIDTPTGFMDGSFHMAIVDPEKTQSASIGTPVDALLWKENDERRFEAKVAEFGFVAEEEVGDRR